jgi:hypothetical protein
VLHARDHPALSTRAQLRVRSAPTAGLRLAGATSTDRSHRIPEPRAPGQSVRTGFAQPDARVVQRVMDAEGHVPSQPDIVTCPPLRQGSLQTLECETSAPKCEANANPGHGDGRVTIRLLRVVLGRAVASVQMEGLAEPRHNRGGSFRHAQPAGGDSTAGGQVREGSLPLAVWTIAICTDPVRIEP